MRVLTKEQRALQHGLAWAAIGGILTALVLPRESCVLTSDGTTTDTATGEIDCKTLPNYRAGIEVGITAGLIGAITAYHN